MTALSKYVAGLALTMSMFMGGTAAVVATAPQAQAADKKPVIQIYHLEGRRSFRAIWACEELKIECEVMFKPGDFAASSAMLRKVNPWVPMYPTAVTAEGQMFVESGAIVEYLVERYGKGKLRPKVDSPDYPGYLQFMHYAEGTAMYRMWAARYAAMMTQQPIENFIKGGTVDGKNKGLVNVQAVADYMEYWLSKHPYFGGKEFSAADIMMQFTVASFKLTAGFDVVNYKRINEWNDRMKARPAFQAAMKRSVPQGANQYGLPEGMKLPFPEPTGPAPVPSEFPPEE